MLKAKTAGARAGRYAYESLHTGMHAAPLYSTVPNWRATALQPAHTFSPNCASKAKRGEVQRGCVKAAGEKAGSTETQTPEKHTRKPNKATVGMEGGTLNRAFYSTGARLGASLNVRVACRTTTGAARANRSTHSRTASGRSARTVHTATS